MMGGFSGTVKISNISDFIAPSQDCIITTQHQQEEKKSKVIKTPFKKINDK